MKEGMEIILIEDNEDDASRLLRFLRSNVNNTVRLFADGAQAAEFILLDKGTSPKLILLDLVLPFVDGIELFHIIRSEPKERNLSVVFLVNSEATKSYVESLGLKPDGYLKKPRDQRSPVRLD